MQEQPLAAFSSERSKFRSRDHVALLVNTKSRKGGEDYRIARKALLEAEVRLEETVATDSVSALVNAVKQAISKKVPLIAVGGGDGSINAVAGLFVGSKSVLGVLPMGTGNAFARDLGMPFDIREACEVLRTGEELMVDISVARDSHFVNVATVGLTTQIAQSLTDPMKRRFGRFAYAFALVRAIRSLRPFKVVLETENGKDEFEALQVVIGNGRFHAGPFPVLPDAHINDGTLSVYSITGERKSELIRFAFALPGGRHARLDEVHAQHCTRGTLRTSPPMRATIDGQVEFDTPFEFKVLPRCLPVVIGPGFRAYLA